MSGQLLHSPADVLRYLLVELGLGTLPSGNLAWPLYVSQEPDTPDNVITVFDTSGLLGGRTMIDGEQQEHHGVQVRVRGQSHGAGYAKIHAIAQDLDKLVRNTVAVPALVGTATYYYRISAVSRKGGIYVLGEEIPVSKRRIFTFNAVVALRLL